MPDDTTMILSARGAFYQVSLASSASASKSIYAVEGLTLNTNSISPQSPILIDGVRTRESDIVSRAPCLNNFKIYYSFGQNFGDISITGQVLLGPMGNLKFDGVKRLLDFFATYRVSVYEQAIKVNLMDKAYLMFLEGLQIMEVDKEYHILPFALFGTQVDISRTAPPNVNPNTVVLSDVNLDDSSLAAALAVVGPSIPVSASNTGTTAASAAAENRGSGNVSFPIKSPAANSGPITPITLANPPPANDPVYTMGIINNSSPGEAYNAIHNQSTSASTNPQAAVNAWNFPASTAAPRIVQP